MPIDIGTEVWYYNHVKRERRDCLAEAGRGPENTKPDAAPNDIKRRPGEATPGRQEGGKPDEMYQKHLVLSGHCIPHIPGRFRSGMA